MRWSRLGVGGDGAFSVDEVVQSRTAWCASELWLALDSQYTQLAADLEWCQDTESCGTLCDFREIRNYTDTPLPDAKAVVNNQRLYSTRFSLQCFLARAPSRPGRHRRQLEVGHQPFHSLKISQNTREILMGTPPPTVLKVLRIGIRHVACLGSVGPGMSS